MTIKRLAAAAFALGLGLVLGSCSSFSDAVSDHWPHFAGGEPDGVPPRPGAPGYNKFIAHGQPLPSAVSTTGNAQPGVTGETATVTNANPREQGQLPRAFTEPQPQNQQAGSQWAPAAAHSGNDPSVGQGGLY